MAIQFPLYEYMKSAYLANSEDSQLSPLQVVSDVCTVSSSEDSAGPCAWSLRLSPLVLVSVYHNALQYSLES